MKKNIYRILIELTNNKFLSSLLMSFSQSRWSKAIIHSYSKVYKIDWKDVEKSESDFRSLHDLFIRKLKEGSRQIHEDNQSVISPVDAVIEDYGTIQSEGTILVKGKTYSMSEMLGSEDALQKYINGQYVILYLSPSHYHRIHSPISGEVQDRWTLGNRSYPVNRMGLKYGKAPLAKNYRVITELRNENGCVAVVKVGAMFVNSIEITNQQDYLQKGEEMAYFSFGSTVVLLFEKSLFHLSEQIVLGSEVKYGQLLGFMSAETGKMKA
ncbi:MAG: phosphatidylserine decarboxylase [Bacillus sp. (in: firmicutes)]